MKFLVVSIALFFSVHSAHTIAFCNGWETLDKICSSSPSSAAFAFCLKRKNAIPSATTFIFEQFQDTSNDVVDKYTYLCRIFDANGTLLDRPGGQVLFSACDSYATSSEAGNTCFVECDVPLVGGICPSDVEDTCPEGPGPINFLTGNKKFTEVDFESGGQNSLHFTRYYNSHTNRIRRSLGGWVSPSKSQESFELNLNFWSGTIRKISELIESSVSPYRKVIDTTIVLDDGTEEGRLITVPKFEQSTLVLNQVAGYWRNNFDKILTRSKYASGSIKLIRPDGNEYVFIEASAESSTYRPKNLDSLGAEQIIAYQDGYIYFKSNLEREYYDIHGSLTSIEFKNGYTQTLTYGELSRLTQVTDSLGGSLYFTHDTQGRIDSMTTPDGFTFHYSYTDLNNNVSFVFYPDGIDDGTHLNNPFRQYVYEDTRYPNAVTGIYENEQRYGTYAYGDDGKAIYSGLANGAAEYSLNFEVAGQTTVTNALGKNTVYHYDTSNNLVQITGEPSANCLGDARNFTYDSNNFKTSETDKNGNLTTYINDALGREISRTEASGTAFARTITTEWHSLLNVKTKVTEPERITNYIYDVNGLLLNQTVSPVAP